MPKPVLKDHDLIKILLENIQLLSEIDKSIDIQLIKNKENILFNCDKEQISRVFLNLIKNSIEIFNKKLKK